MFDVVHYNAASALASDADRLFADGVLWYAALCFEEACDRASRLNSHFGGDHWFAVEQF